MLDKIIKIICAIREISIKEVGLNNRKQNIVETRFILFYILKEYCFLTLTEIGNILAEYPCGTFDHSTVLHGIKRIKELYEIEPVLKKEIDSIVDLVTKEKAKNFNINTNKNIFISDIDLRTYVYGHCLQGLLSSSNYGKTPDHEEIVKRASELTEKSLNYLKQNK